MKKNEEKLKVALSKVETLKVEISKKRDELRDAVEEVNEILECMDRGNRRARIWGKGV